MKNRKVLFCIVILTLWVGSGYLFGQMEEISEKDKESLEEAKELKSEAEEMQISANDLYLEAAMLEQNENFLSDKKIQREYKKLQSDAQKTELKAAEKFEESNQVQKEIYEKYIDEFWKNFGGDESVLINAKLIEETSKEYFVRASSARDEAKRIDNQTEKFIKLSEAYEYELIGIEKLQSAYNIYKHWPDPPSNESGDENIDFQISDSYIEEDTSDSENLLDNEEAETVSPAEATNQNVGQSNPQIMSTDTSSDESNIDANQGISEFENLTSENVAVNPDQVEKILRYMEEEDDTVYYLANEVEGYDMNSIRDFWDNYRSISYEDEQTEPLLAQENQDDELTADQTEEVVPENVEAENVQPSTGTEANSEQSEDTEVEIGRVTETVVPDPNSKIIYRIQIAADKAPLSQPMLQKLFYANHKIAMVDEGGWYKYSIGEFDTFEEADEFRKTLDRDDAFVVAYRDAINVQYVEKGESQTRESLVSVKTKQRPGIQGKDIVFVVQVAASREPMDESSLKKIYNGNLSIKLREEDNWYKYQIGHTNSYLEIKEVKNNVDVKGAFIAAYEGERKLKLWQAIKEVHSADDKIIFVVQIAASKVRLSNEKINLIFSGNDHVVEIYEDGWYKYHIVCGNTYSAARRFKNLWGIKNAFIVAYKNNKKIDIRQAIRETSN